MEPGELVDERYEIESRLGHGATATVFRAHDRELGRTVAVKMFGPTSELSDAQRRRQEAQALAALRHPAIVAIFDARLDRDPPYLVLEYVPGRTLAEELARGALDGDRARTVVASAAQGLARAHAEGILHRDVKPANILLPQDDDAVAARLLDFGIAHSLGDPRRTTAGTVVGSASYLSPEQARGDELGPATDVYSLGLVLIECLTGTPAYAGSTPAAVAERLHAAPSLADPKLAAEAQLLARMTALEAADRPTAAEVAALLATPAPTRVLPVPTDTPTEVLAPTEAIEVSDDYIRVAEAGRSVPARRRRLHPAAVAGIGAALLVAAGLVGGSLVAGGPGPALRTPAPAVPDDEPSAPAVDGPGNNGNDGNNGNNGNNGNGNGPKDD